VVSNTLTKYLPETYDFTNVQVSQHTVHLTAAQPVNTTLLGLTCEGASSYIYASRRYPSGGTFTYMGLDLGKYTDGLSSQTGFVVPLLRGYFEYLRGPH
jgi:hypothetical protein